VAMGAGRCKGGCLKEGMEGRGDEGQVEGLGGSSVRGC